MRAEAKVRPMMDVLVPGASLVRGAILVASFAVITALFARITIPVPWSLVPITGQTFAVLLAGAVLGSRRGALSQIVYLAVGATGMPFWFSATTKLGIAGLMGPTGGFLIGFVPTAFVVGLLAERGWDRRFGTAVLAMLIGEVVLYLFGVPWMARFSNVITYLYNNAIQGWPWLASLPGGLVFKAGILPFIPGDLTKIFLAAAALPSAWVLVRGLKGRL